MYVAVKGGEAAIDAAHALLSEARRGDPAVPEVSLAQIDEQLALAVDRVMAEGSLYDRELAALAVKQARGDLVEAVFLLRAYRTTLPRLAVTAPVETVAMRCQRRVSAVFKDVPGGQPLGPTFDYTHRLLDFALAEPALPGDPPAGQGGGAAAEPKADPRPEPEPMPHVTALLDREGLIEAPPADGGEPVGDLTRAPLAFPAPRAVRLQNLARGDEGFLMALGYSTQRGFGSTHPFAGEIRCGAVAVEIVPEELGFPVTIGEITVTECEMVNQFQGSATVPPRFTRGYGLTFGEGERKAMAMALCDRALRAAELGEEPAAPAQDAEFVLYHSDNVEASGFVQHLKLPHYVDFQAELSVVRRMREEAAAHAATAESEAAAPREAAE
jgi:alpha-D-ribose 1-methylphosphonate 5-triphosphate synthase subunit PhnI